MRFFLAFLSFFTIFQTIMKDSILILSGGVDSTTLLYDEQERIALAISFDYGSKHNARKIPFARWHCEQLGIRHIVIPLDFMTRYFKSSLLEGGEEILSYCCGCSSVYSAIKVQHSKISNYMLHVLHIIAESICTIISVTRICYLKNFLCTTPSLYFTIYMPQDGWVICLPSIE